MESLKSGQTVYLIESRCRGREAVIRGRAGDLFTLRFTDTVGGIRLPADRLYPTRETAQASLRQKKAEKQQPLPAPGYWHNVPAWESMFA